MRKKYLSALLFGALLVTSAGTFTSCKDYDDDINNLQEQIDKLATKEDMEAKLSQMQSAIDAAKTTAEEALAKAEAAGDSEEVNDLKERVAALEEAMAKVEELKAEIKTMVDEQLGEFRVEMQEFMKEVEELTGYSLGMVTGISFVVNKPSEYSPALNANFARVNTIYIPDADYVAGTQDYSKDGFKVAGNSYTFGKDLAGAFTINVKDINTVADEMLVKLDPVDAVVSSEMLSLINGKGEDLNGYVNMTVKPWSGDIIASRSEAKTGLYEVGVQLKNDVDFEAFDKMVLPVPGHDWDNCDDEDATQHKYNMFALAVTDTEKSRTVSSDYEVSLHVQEEKEAIGIPANTYVESIGTNDETSRKAIENYDTGNDDRECIEVKLGSSFNLLVGSAYYAKKPQGGRVMASYVVVDINNKTLSSTDKAAINGLTITGVDEVSKTLKHTITINGASGVAVPMKLVTIDYTGVVKENIFWVKAGEGIELSSAFTVTPIKHIANPTTWAALELAKANKADLQEFTIPAGTNEGRLDMVIGEADNAYKEYNGTFTIGTADGKLTSGVITVKGVDVIQLYKANKTKAEVGTPIKDVAYAAFIGEMNLQSMREDKAYSGTIKFYGEEKDDYVGARMISVTKKLPTDVPADFSAKTNAINNGVLTVYPTANTDKTGKFALKNAFNGLESGNPAIYDTNYILDMSVVEEEFDVTGIFNTSNQTLTAIPSDAINSGEAYDAAYKYNYGEIKYIPVGHGTEAPEDCIITWSTKFAIKFGCVPFDATYTWSNGAPKVYYKESITIEGKTADKSDFIDVVDPYKKTIDPFRPSPDTDVQLEWTDYAAYFNENTEIKLITGDGKVNEFFTAKFVKETTTNKYFNLELTVVESTNVVLSGDVKTKVVITITDKFGHPHDIELLEFTMLKSH